MERFYGRQTIIYIKRNNFEVFSHILICTLCFHGSDFFSYFLKNNPEWKYNDYQQDNNKAGDQAVFYV